MQLRLGYAQRIALVQAVPLRRVTPQSSIAVMPHIVNDATHSRLNLGQIIRAALLQRLHELVLLRAVKNAKGRNIAHRVTHHITRDLVRDFARHFAHHITTLFNGYSTMPWAFACLSFGIRVQAVCSSMTVLTATHSPSAKGATVGFFNAGSTPRTAARSCLRTLSIRPTRPCAAMAPQSITARFSILRLRSGSAHAALFAINCVFDSSTVSIIRRWLARRELPVSVTSTMSSASNGGLTSVAPQENSTCTGTSRLAK